MVQEMTEEAYVAFFNVPARYEGQKSIFFGRFKPELMTHESLEDGPSQNSHLMMKMGYDLAKRSGLNFSKGRRALLQSLIPKGKPLIIIIKLEEVAMCQL